MRLFLFPHGMERMILMADLRHGGNVWEGGDPSRWLDFSANLRPEGAPEWVMRTMRAALDDTRYYPDRTLAAARRGLAAYLDVPERCVLPTAGGAAAIDAVLARGRGAVHVFPVTFGARGGARARNPYLAGNVRPRRHGRSLQPQQPHGARPFPRSGA